MRDFPVYDAMKQLLPQNCFIGINDPLPGLVNDKIPHPRASGQGGPLGTTVKL